MRLWWQKKRKEPVMKAPSGKEPGQIGWDTCPKHGGIRGGIYCKDCGSKLRRYIDPLNPWCPRCKESREFSDKFCFYCSTELVDCPIQELKERLGESY